MNGRRVLGLALLAIGTAAAQASATSDLWLHIRVRDGEEGSKVSLTLPLSVVEAATPLIPDRARSCSHIRIDDRDLSVADMRKIWSELRRHPDADYVTVDGGHQGNGNVRVARRGGYLVMRTRDTDRGGEQVEIKIPVAVVDALLSGGGDRFNVAAAIEALVRQGEGELVTVNGDNETVRMWVDRESESR
jgi:hypothetical protein